MKLAIIIEGDQNSGKTTTIKELINHYHGWKKVKHMRTGWNELAMNITVFPYLKLIIYALSGSPSEQNSKLSDRFDKLGKIPEVIVVPLQPNGRYYADSNEFLSSNGYYVLKYTLSNTEGNGIWDRFTNAAAATKLKDRADLIIKDITNFIKTNNLL